MNVMARTLLRCLLTVSVLISIVASGCGDDEDDYLVSTVGPLVGGECLDILDCVSGSAESCTACFEMFCRTRLDACIGY